MEKQGTIYKIENTINGKVYIGQTIMNINKRIARHKYELGVGQHHSQYLQRAWDKYGEGAFEFSVIKKCPKNELDKEEIEHIKRYDSFKNGYNMTSGGVTNSHKKPHTEQSKKKMSIKSRKRWQDEEYREKMKNIPRAKGEKANKSVKVICINDNKIFGSMTLAGEYYGIDFKSISACCAGKNEYVGLRQTGIKLEFAYYDEEKQYKLKAINHINEKRRIKCIDTGQTFNSLNEAEIKTGITKASISHVCHGRRNHAGGMEWEFI